MDMCYMSDTLLGCVCANLFGRFVPLYIYLKLFIKVCVSTCALNSLCAISSFLLTYRYPMLPRLITPPYSTSKILPPGHLMRPRLTAPPSSTNTIFTPGCLMFPQCATLPSSSDATYPCGVSSWHGPTGSPSARNAYAREASKGIDSKASEGIESTTSNGVDRNASEGIGKRLIYAYRPRPEPQKISQFLTICWELWVPFNRRSY